MAGELLPMNCIECLVAWLLYGDGAVCLLHRTPVYWIGEAASDDD